MVGVGCMLIRVAVAGNRVCSRQCLPIRKRVVVSIPISPIFFNQQRAFVCFLSVILIQLFRFPRPTRIHDYSFILKKFYLNFNGKSKATRVRCTSEIFPILILFLIYFGAGGLARVRTSSRRIIRSGTGRSGEVGRATARKKKRLEREGSETLDDSSHEPKPVFCASYPLDCSATPLRLPNQIRTFFHFD
jgi:hypothetical protein